MHTRGSGRRTRNAHARKLHAHKMRVVDLFAGVGGLTAGALEAGAEVVLAVDSDPTPLKRLGANSPGTTTVVATLGEGAHVDLPPAAPDLHLHASTPCTDLSAARKRGVGADVAAGIRMMRWAVEFVLGRGDHSWSLENVVTAATRALLTELAAKYPDKVAFGLFDSAEFGAPQRRVRMIAGPPKLISMLQAIPVSRQVSVREAFERAGREVAATHSKNQTRNRYGVPAVRAVETTSFTVCAAHALTWCDAEGKTVRTMSAAESAVLMGFPKNWLLPDNSKAAQAAVGNAMCVSLARAIVEAAIATHRGETMVVPRALPPSPPKKRPPTEAQLYRRLRRRITRLEGRLAEPRFNEELVA